MEEKLHKELKKLKQELETEIKKCRCIECDLLSGHNEMQEHAHKEKDILKKVIERRDEEIEQLEEEKNRDDGNNSSTESGKTATGNGETAIRNKNQRTK